MKNINKDQRKENTFIKKIKYLLFQKFFKKKAKEKEDYKTDDIYPLW